MPEPKRPLKVFLCHAHSNQVAVRALYKRLEKDGIDAWLDKEKLLAGANWEHEIRKAVRESDVVIVCISQQFSDGGFRQKEVQIALDEAALKPKEEIFIIPVRLEECNVPEQLMNWHWVDLFRRGGYYKLLKSLKSRASQQQLTTVKLPKLDETNPAQEPRNGISVHVDGNVQGNIIIGDENAVQTPQVQSVELEHKTAAQVHWMPTDALQDGKPYISIDITSEENRLLKCYCYTKSLELNGVLRDDIKHEIVKHTNRVSWSGGSDEGIGIKYIDRMGFGKINLASLDSSDFIRLPLQFETAKGPQSKDRNGNSLPFGIYAIVLGLSCIVDGVDFPEIPMSISFEYAEEYAYHEDNYIKGGKTMHRVLRLSKKEKPLSAQPDLQAERIEPKPELVAPISEKQSEIVSAILPDKKPDQTSIEQWVFWIRGIVSTLILLVVTFFLGIETGGLVWDTTHNGDFALSAAIPTWLAGLALTVWLGRKFIWNRHFRQWVFWIRGIVSTLILLTITWFLGDGTGYLLYSIFGPGIAGVLGATPTWLAGLALTVWLGRKFIWKRH